MAIEILGIEKSCLEYDRYFKLIKKYTASLKQDVSISFDLRLKSIYGNHCFDYETKKHIIKISPIMCSKDGDARIDEEAQKYNYIAVTIHEIKHAMQQEKLGSLYESKKFSTNKKIKHSSMSEYYSILEIEARIFEEQNVNSAVEYYNNQ
jgi:hypothetical protein